MGYLTRMQHLKRYPLRKNELLQAWDSADELILQHLQNEQLAGKRLLIINDQFGALSDGLKLWDLTVYTDSFVSATAIRMNTAQQIQPLHELQALQGSYDYVLIKLPKSLAYFEDLLCHLSQNLGPGAQVICGAMVKHLSAGYFDLLEKYIGHTTTSLAQKKARLIFASFTKAPVTSPYPIKVRLDGMIKEFIHHSNLFSREKLDIGTRFFLEHIPSGKFMSILDLGCANGVVGIKAKELNSEASIIFSDDSAMAIASAQANYQNHFSDEAQFIWTNCYEQGAANSLDLVLCNPPFHQSTTIGDHIAWQMFLDAQHALKPGGQIRVIGNSHLNYQQKLKKIFGNSKLVASNAKFTIIDAIKRSP
jgi:23S rRNA (guanine1835-N2)-methyltransferase